MTTGQRIAAKRKEIELSQEALGEKLGVSRQTIYKWEADASLPEVDKLVSLSRLFGVPVGWLLGVEELPETAPAGLTEEQWKGLEKLLFYSQAAVDVQRAEDETGETENPRTFDPPRQKRRRWPWVVAAMLLVIVGVSLFSRLNRLENQVSSLSGSIRDINWTMGSRIDSMAGRVEEILNAQNSLIASYSVDIDRVDPAENTVTFTARITPKTYVEGMEVHLLADSVEGVEETVLEENTNHLFSGEVTCSLTDAFITLSAVLVDGETRQTQQLEEYFSLYTNSFPDVQLLDHSALGSAKVEKNGLYPLRDIQVEAVVFSYGGKFGDAVVADIQVGLFQNQRLAAWLEPEDGTAEFLTGGERHAVFRLADMELAVEKGDVLTFAALITDQYGRRYMAVSLPEYSVQDGWLSYAYDRPSIDHIFGEDMEDWSFQ